MFGVTSVDPEAPRRLDDPAYVDRLIRKMQQLQARQTQAEISSLRKELAVIVTERRSRLKVLRALKSAGPSADEMKQVLPRVQQVLNQTLRLKASATQAEARSILAQVELALDNDLSPPSPLPEDEVREAKVRIRELISQIESLTFPRQWLRPYRQEVEDFLQGIINQAGRYLWEQRQQRQQGEILDPQLFDYQVREENILDKIRQLTGAESATAPVFRLLDTLLLHYHGHIRKSELAAVGQSDPEFLIPADLKSGSRPKALQEYVGKQYGSSALLRMPPPPEPFQVIECADADKCSSGEGVTEAARKAARVLLPSQMIPGALMAQDISELVMHGPGSGKTATAVKAILNLMAKPEFGQRHARYAFIMVPDRQGQSNWEKEIRGWSDTLGFSWRPADSGRDPHVTDTTTDYVITFKGQNCTVHLHDIMAPMKEGPLIRKRRWTANDLTEFAAPASAGEEKRVYGEDLPEPARKALRLFSAEQMARDLNADRISRVGFPTDIGNDQTFPVFLDEMHKYMDPPQLPKGLYVANSPLLAAWAITICTDMRTVNMGLTATPIQDERLATSILKIGRILNHRVKRGRNWNDGVWTYNKYVLPAASAQLIDHWKTIVQFKERETDYVGRTCFHQTEDGDLDFKTDEIRDEFSTIMGVVSFFQLNTDFRRYPRIGESMWKCDNNMDSGVPCDVAFDATNGTFASRTGEPLNEDEKKAMEDNDYGNIRPTRIYVGESESKAAEAAAAAPRRGKRGQLLKPKKPKKASEAQLRAQRISADKARATLALLDAHKNAKCFQFWNYDIQGTEFKTIVQRYTEAAAGTKYEVWTVDNLFDRDSVGETVSTFLNDLRTHGVANRNIKLASMNGTLSLDEQQRQYEAGKIAVLGTAEEWRKDVFTELQRDARKVIFIPRLVDQTLKSRPGATTPQQGATVVERVARQLGLDFFKERDPLNDFGQVFPLLVGSKDTTQTGIDLMETLVVMFGEPIKYKTIRAQVIGRVMRNCAIMGLDRRASVEVYVLVSPAEQAQLAEEEGVTWPDFVLDYLRSASIDCPLFRDYLRTPYCLASPLIPDAEEPTAAAAAATRVSSVMRNEAFCLDPVATLANPAAVPLYPGPNCDPNKIEVEVTPGTIQRMQTFLIAPDIRNRMLKYLSQDLSGQPAAAAAASKIELVS